MDKYRLVQDLWEVNQIVQHIHPVEANPYTLLTALTVNQWLTVIFLKDAFFFISFNKQNKSIFAIEWESPQTGQKTQLTRTVLPQAFKNSPVIFESQLIKEL